jgi:superkiller protein 3
MGILTDDEGLVDAALSELLSLPTEKRQERDPGGEVDYLMSRYYLSQVRNNQSYLHSPTWFRLMVLQGDPDKAMTALADPSIRSTRTLLASLLLQRGDPAGASAVLLPPTTPDAEREEGPVRAVAVTRMNGQGVRAAQRAVLLAPWEAGAWGALAFACCQESNDQ